MATPAYIRRLRQLLPEFTVEYVRNSKEWRVSRGSFACEFCHSARDWHGTVHWPKPSQADRFAEKVKVYYQHPERLHAAVARARRRDRE